MTKNNLKLLDMDEHFREEIYASTNKDLLDFCKKYGLVLDLATSDVVGYLEDKHGQSVCIG